jgi:hypothetical protein
MAKAVRVLAFAEQEIQPGHRSPSSRASDPVRGRKIGLLIKVVHSKNGNTQLPRHRHELVEHWSYLGIDVVLSLREVQNWVEDDQLKIAFVPKELRQPGHVTNRHSSMALASAAIFASQHGRRSLR